MEVDGAQETKPRPPLAVEAAAQVYVRYLVRVVRSLRERKFPELTHEETIALDELLPYWALHDGISVLNAVKYLRSGGRLSRWPSSPKVYGLIWDLRNKGWITEEVWTGDKRIKLLRPSTQAIRYFEVLANCMTQSLLAQQTSSLGAESTRPKNENPS